VKRFLLVQPWGHKKATESTVLSEHDSRESAFAEVDRLAEQMVKTGVAPDVVEIVVNDRDGQRVTRPNSH